MSLGVEDTMVCAALLIHPRASWPLLSEVLGIPESTVARRGRRLLERGVVRVIGNIDVMVAGWGFPVLLRVETDQVHTDSVAQSLAARSEVRTLTIAAGSFQCNADIVVDSPEHLARLIVHEFPKIPGIRHVSTHVVLRRFTTAHSWDFGGLSAEQVTALTAARPDAFSHDEYAHEVEVPAPARRLTSAEERIIAAIQDDGRISWRRLAELTDSQERTARRRTLDLMSRGVLRMRTFVRPADLGFHVTATLWISVEPAHLERAGQYLAKNKSVTLLVATTGRFNLCGEISTVSNRSLYQFMTDFLGRLPGIQQIDVALEMSTLKRMSLIQPTTKGNPDE